MALKVEFLFEAGLGIVLSLGMTILSRIEVAGRLHHVVEIFL